MKNISTTISAFITLAIVMCASSCEDFVQIPLPDSRIGEQAVFSDDETALAAATGMYATMLEANSFIGQFYPLSYIGGLSSDELVDLTGTAQYSEFYSNQLSVNNSTVLNIWSSLYRTIYEANAVIEGVSSSGSLSADIQRQVEGEGKFVRAFCLFYLVNLFGDVPIITTTDYRENATAGRMPVANVYEQIETDLLDASELLSEDYLTEGKNRPNEWSVVALWARVALYRGDYQNAEKLSSSVINSGIYFIAQDLNEVFVSNSQESILELPQVYPDGFPTADGAKFLLNQFIRSSTLTSDLLESFDASDARYTNWTVSFDGVHYDPHKYKVRYYFDDANYPENLVLLRLAEQYLIRAEARLELDDLSGAISDVNVIRNRAGLPDTDASDENALRAAIQDERRWEFFCEMGHRWLDLKRTNAAGSVLGAVKPGWNSTDVLFPIPEQEMLNNPKLVPQNAGY